MWRKLSLTFAVAVPAVVLRLAGIHLPPGLAILIFGAGVVTTAVILSWAAEAAQVDISSAAAIAILAVVAVLPEYAVDLYFAYTAGSHPEYTQFAAANMTGSNRLASGDRLAARHVRRNLGSPEASSRSGGNGGRAQWPHRDRTRVE